MNKLIMFCLGAAFGSLLTWKIVEKKYKDIADEEIKSVIDRFKNRDKEINEKTNEETHEETNEKIVKEETHEKHTKRIPRKEYNKIANDLGYDIKEDDNIILTKEEDGSIYMETGKDYAEPYVISPEEFGEIEYYTTKSWTYYSDFMITDEDGEVVGDPENIIGDALSHFGEYEDDSVHVRNEELECDYEIIKCDKSFSEMNGRITNDI